MNQETRDTEYRIRDTGHEPPDLAVSRVAYPASRVSDQAPPITIVNGPGVLAEQPVIQQAPQPTVVFHPSSRRKLVESAVLFVSAILFLRTIAIEPFGVPTGSMAPTLSGNHRALACPRCAYAIRIGEPSNKQQGYPEVHCPNCGAKNLSVATAAEVSGDRLLVDKNVLRLRTPRRWEVAVFICPSDKSKPYVKRVVGLPGEQIQLRDGDVWIDGQLARKTLAQARECKVPVFDVDFAPAGGWRRRWYAEGTQPVLGAAEPPPLPDWFTLDGNDLRISKDGATTSGMVAYWHVSLDALTPEVIRDGFEYNGHGSGAHDYAVHDFLVEFEVEVVSGNGFVICKLTDGADEATAQIAAGGEFGESKLLSVTKGLLKATNRPPLKPGQTYRIEMAHVDRRVSVAIDGREYFTHDFPTADRREDVTSPFRIGGQGVTLVVRHVRLYRDIYYRAGDRHAAGSPYRLGAGEYFLLGDNSANSDDSRSWQIPAVPERNFLGKPFLLHQPSRPTEWSLGGRRMEGQSIDWGRIRWLR
jgi:signal peptidase I